MCFKRNKKNPKNNNYHWLHLADTTPNATNIRVPVGSEFAEQFIDLHEMLTKRLGTPVSKTMVVRHAIALTYQHYKQEVGL